MSLADVGTNARTSASDDRRTFESIIASIHGTLANSGAHLTIDAAARQAYDQRVRAMSEELRQKATRGQITWRQAATEANTVRNTVMEAIRGRSTPVGRAIAESLKKEGRTLNEMIARKTNQFFPGRTFQSLTPTEQNRVFAEIVKSAGKSDPTITGRMRTLSRAGRGLIVLSVALSIYNVATAENKGQAATREVAVTGAGIGGGVAGGALAGLACGPGAPVCVTVGAFVGGALAAFGVDMLF